MKDLLTKQQEYVHDLISQHKSDLEELVTQSTTNPTTFRNKGIEKQYSFNGKVLRLVKKVKKGLKKRKDVTNLVKEVIDLLDTHAEDLLVADSSRHGWLTVHQLRGRQTLSSDLLQKVDRIDSRLDRTRKDGFKGSSGYNKKMDGKDRVQTYRKKQGPEEFLQSLVGRKREGTCSHCSEIGHFYRECPDFWKEVQESRKKSTP